jgi:hypothetical protein
MTLNRREFVQLAAAMGASLAWGGSPRASTTGWHERRDLYPEASRPAIPIRAASSSGRGGRSNTRGPGPRE